MLVVIFTKARWPDKKALRIMRQDSAGLCSLFMPPELPIVHSHNHKIMRLPLLEAISPTSQSNIVEMLTL